MVRRIASKQTFPLPPSQTRWVVFCQSALVPGCVDCVARGSDCQPLAPGLVAKWWRRAWGVDSRGLRAVLLYARIGGAAFLIMAALCLLAMPACAGLQSKMARRMREDAAAPDRRRGLGSYHQWM